MDCRRGQRLPKKPPHGKKEFGEASQRRTPRTSLCNGSENNPKSGANETLRNFIVARGTRSTVGPETHRVVGDARDHRTPAPASPPVHGNPTDDNSDTSSDCASSPSSSTASSGRNSARRDWSSAKLRPIPEVNSRQRRLLLCLPRVCCQQRLRKLIPRRLHRPSEQLNL